MNPTLKQLEAVYWSNELGSFQAAAKRLHTTPSAISKRVTDFEDMLGVKLFNHRNKQSKLTTDGVRVVKISEEILKLSKMIMDGVSTLPTFKGKVRLGSSELVALTWLPKLIEVFRTNFPDVIIEADVDLGMRLLRKLEADLLDIAFLPGPVPGRSFKSTRLTEAEVTWAASPDLDIGDMCLSATTICNYPLIVHHSESIATQLFDSWFSEIGVMQRSNISTNSLLVMAQLTKAGMGISRLPVGYLRRDFESGGLQKLRSKPPLSAQTYFAIRLGENESPLVEKVVEIAQRVCCFEAPAQERKISTLE